MTTHGPNTQLRAARGAAGLTQEALAEQVNRVVGQHERSPGTITANNVHRWESGLHRWPRRCYRAALREIFAVASDRDLGFYSTRSAVTVDRGTGPHREGDDVKRKEFLAGLAALAAVGSLPAPAAEATERAHTSARIGRVGRREIDQIEHAISMFGQWQDARGGGDCLAPLAAQVAYGHRLLDAHGSADIQRALHSSVGFLANIAGWGAFDAGEYRAADRYFDHALSCADTAQDWGLRANVLSDQARKASYLQRHDDALELIEHAQVRQDRLAHRARSMLEIVRARILAALHRDTEARTSVHRAEDHLAHAGPAENDPAWIQYFDSAELHADAGTALLATAVRGRHIDDARDRLTRSLPAFGADNARARALALGKLARLELAVGEPEHGVQLGHQALDADRHLRSRRAADDLRELRTALTPHRALPAAGALHSQLASLT